MVPEGGGGNGRGRQQVGRGSHQGGRVGRGSGNAGRGAKYLGRGLPVMMIEPSVAPFRADQRLRHQML